MRCDRPRVRRRDVLAIGGAAAAMIAGLSAVPTIGRAAPVRQMAGRAFGTTWHATLPDTVSRTAFAARARGLLFLLDTAMSPWRVDSLVSAFNRSPGSMAPRNADLALVARQSLAIAAASNGQFDPTVGPLVARFGFGPINEGADRPNWRRIEVEGNRVVKTAADTTFDPCGIAKGHALDRLSALARSMGAQSGLIEFGGEIVAWGRHPDGRTWRAGVEDPRPGMAGIVATLALEDATLATSGNKVNGYHHSGRTYGHIIAPDLATPRQTRLLSVTVQADTAMVADGWATALMAAGSDLGHRLAVLNGLDALFVIDRPGDLPALLPTGTITIRKHRA